MDNGAYPNINMEKTGLLLKKKITEHGYTVKEIQECLQLSCPQPVYRWFKGKVLPSLGHLLMLSRMLKVHMEELLVVEEDIYMQDRGQSIYEMFYDAREIGGHMGEGYVFLEGIKRRMLVYWKRLYVSAV